MKQKKINMKLETWNLKLATILIVVGIITSCSNDEGPSNFEFMPDMYRSPSYETYSTSNFFKDGMTARKPVESTIARGQMPYPFPNTIEGYEMAGDSLKNPIPLTDETLEQGKELYSIFCTHCHGQTGQGDGAMIKNDKYPPPPSYSKKLKDLSEGKMFHSITFGKNLMGSHASQLLPDERWKIVHYIKTLQK